MDYQQEIELLIRTLSRPKAAALSMLCAMLWLKRFHGPVWEIAELAEATGFSADAIGEGKPFLLKWGLVRGAGASGRYGLILVDRAVQQLGLWDLAPVGQVVEQMSETGKTGVAPAAEVGLRLVGGEGETGNTGVAGELSTLNVESETGNTGVAGVETGKTGVTPHVSSSSSFLSYSSEFETTTTPPQARPEKPVSRPLPERYARAAVVLEEELGLSRAYAVQVASDALKQEWGGAWLEYQALRWLVYCCSPNGRGINSIPGFVGARLRDGQVAPGFTKADSWDMKKRIDRLWAEVQTEEVEREEHGGPEQ